jgi:hypothetical protein
MRAMLLGIAVAVSVAACSNSPPPDPAVQDCERQAEDDPQVKALANRALANAQLMVDLRDDIKFAYKQAVVACLRKKGIGPKGGVEPLQP